MIPLSTPNLTGNEARYLNECISSTYVSYVGAFVGKFEELIAQASGSKGGVAVSSGTTGLHLALRTVGVRPNDLVILPTLTFIASANAIAHCYASPFLIDVNAKTWNLDPDFLETVLKSETRHKNGELIHKKTGRPIRAIMPVYTLGLPADMDRINQIANQFGLPVIADAACALGSIYKNKPVGSLATMSVFSFNGNKTVTCGGGGVIVSQDELLLAKAKHLSTTARLPGIEYVHDDVGFNYRMTNLQAAVGCAQIERLDEFIKIKRRIRNKYNSALTQNNGILAFPEVEWAKSSYWLSGIVLNESRFNVLDVCNELYKNDIEAKPFWKPIHLQAPYRGVPRSTVVYAESIWNKVITLPSSTHLTEEQQDEVIQSLTNIIHPLCHK